MTTKRVVVRSAVDPSRYTRTFPTVYFGQLSLAKRYRRTSTRASMSMEQRTTSEQDAAAIQIQSFVRAVQARKR